MDGSKKPGATDVGFIGLGKMGIPMVMNLLAGRGQVAGLGQVVGLGQVAGLGQDGPIGTVTVTGRSVDRAGLVLAAGARWVSTPREVADASSVIVLMVPDLPEVEELLFDGAAITTSEQELVVVVCSTVSGTKLREVAARLAKETGGRMRVVDAPVSGGTEGAADGTLSIMVGGAVGDVELVLPVLRRLGTPVRVGELGSGEVVKACNQLIVAATMSAIAEASVIIERHGIDLPTALALFQGGYAGSRLLESKSERLIQRDYDAGGGGKFLVKDLNFAASAARDTRTVSIVLDAARQVFSSVVEAGLGDLDMSAVHRYVAEID